MAFRPTGRHDAATGPPVNTVAVQEDTSMVSNIVRTLIVGAALAVAHTTAAPLAHAACAIPDAAVTTGRLGGQAKPIAYAAVTGVSTGDERNDSIVGLWQVVFVSKGNPGIPDDAVLDSGYATWHSDGTEIMNSSKPPKTGSFCMGVWKKTGRATYHLNHVALSWDPTGSTFVGPANIREEVTVDAGGTTYTGTFTIDQYDPAGTLLVHVTGDIVAYRITADE
jgi:hypothetical protein